MYGQDITDAFLREQLVAVGAERTIDTADFDRSFEELNLDSLALVEIATRIQDEFGIDIEDQLDLTTTPNDIRRLVRMQPAGAGA